MGLEYQQNLSVKGTLTYDKYITLLEDCEGTFNWLKAGTGADYVAEFATEAAMTGNHGIVLQTKATAPAKNDYVKIYRNLPWPASGKLTTRVKFNIQSRADLGTFRIACKVYDGARYYYFHTNYYAELGHVNYYADPGVSINPAELYNVWSDDAWIQEEVVLDVESKKIISISLDGIKHDAGNRAMYYNNVTTRRYIVVEIYMSAWTDQRPKLYLDNIYIGSK